jgi:hypothetical protein
LNEFTLQVPGPYALNHRDDSAANLTRSAIVVGVPLLALLGLILFGKPLFETNDDCGLAMIGAGFGTAVEPEPHFIFAHFGYGVLLNLISRFAGPNAHGWTTLAALGVSIGLYARAISGDWREDRVLVGAALLIGLGCVFTRALLAFSSL